MKQTPQPHSTKYQPIQGWDFWSTSEAVNEALEIVGSWE